MKAESVGMMPIYTGVKGEEKQGLATGSENYWCINDKASDADKEGHRGLPLLGDHLRHRQEGHLRTWGFTHPRSRPSMMSSLTTR